MKLKILQEGWEAFTGDFGGVQFVDGVSVDDVNPRVARRLANVVLLETLEGVNPSASQAALDMKTIPMDIEKSSASDTAISSQMAPKVWTKEQLEEIANAKGIAGIREISDPMNLRSNSIARLIEMVLQAQAEGSDKTPSLIDTLIGSSIQPSSFEIDGKQIALGVIVSDAFARSGLTVSEWNDLPAELREEHIAKQVVLMKGV